jgi:hypothetical protein
MSDQRDYDMRLNDMYGSLTLIDLPSEIAAHKPWFNQTLTTVNDAVVRLGILEGEFHWHKHDAEDEFFLVLDGELLIDLEDRESVASERTRIHGAERHRPSHAGAAAYRGADGRSRRGRTNRGLAESAASDAVADHEARLITALGARSPPSARCRPAEAECPACASPASPDLRC